MKRWAKRLDSNELSFMTQDDIRPSTTEPLRRKIVHTHDLTKSKRKGETDSFFISDICDQACSPSHRKECELTNRSMNSSTKKSDFKMRRREFRTFIREQEMKKMPIPTK